MHISRYSHDCAFQDSDCSNKLDKSGRRDGVGSDERSNTIGEGVEGVSGVVNVSRKVESSTGHNLAEEGKLTDTAVFDFNITEAVKTFLADISSEHAEGIVESERRLGAKLILEGANGRRGLGHGRRSESGGGADKGSDDSRLHD